VLLVPVALVAFIGLEAPDHRFNRYCVGAFFMGGVAFLLYRRLIGKAWVETMLRVSLLVAWSLTIVSIRAEITFRWGGRFAVALLFPATVLYLALAETRRGTLWKGAAWLGDISYSSYLLHFPLQLLCVLLLPREVFASPIALVGFFAALIGLSLVSYRFFERPAQAWIRRRWVARTTASAARGPARHL
jgi:peptidoglycan/LPS O-acetylase OafA/YrhL